MARFHSLILFSALLLCGGCIMSRRESYSFSNVAVEKDTPRLSRKYHIVEMKIAVHSVSDDGSAMPHYCELDWNERFRHERLLPDVFSADGCPVRVYLINDFHDAMDEPVACFGFGTAVLNVLGYATLGVLPIYDAYDSVVTCEVVPDKASHGRRMTLHAYNESWTSLFGATGALMPFSKPSDSRFSTGWHQDHGLISTRDTEDEQIALRRKAIAHAIVAVLRAMESAAEIPDKD